MSKNRRQFFFALQVAFSLLLLWILFRQIPWSEFRAKRTQLATTSIILAQAAFIISFVLNSLNWRFILARMRVKVSFGTVCGATFVGLFYGALIPSAISADVARGVRLYQSTSHQAEIAMSILIDRLTGFIVFSGVLGLGLFFYAEYLPFRLEDTLWQFLVLALIGLALLGGLTVIARWHPHLFAAYIRALREFSRQPLAFIVAVLITLGVHLFFALTAWLICRQFWEDASLVYCLLITEILNIADVLPISVSGLGVRETIYVVMLRPFGVETAEALVISLTQFFVVLMTALLGGLYEVYLSSQPVRRHIS